MKILVNASQILTLLMLKRPNFEHSPFYDVANDLSQFNNNLSLKEDDVMLHKLPFGSANAVNEVSKQSSASKEDTQFSMGQSWFQNGRIDRKSVV